MSDSNIGPDYDEVFNSLTNEVELDETSDETSSATIENARKILIDAMEEVARAAVHMAKHAESEQIRANMIKYLLESHLKGGKVAEDMWEKVLTDIHGKAKSKK